MLDEPIATSTGKRHQCRRHAAQMSRIQKGRNCWKIEANVIKRDMIGRMESGWGYAG
jgi:hypothetical protein